MNSLLRLSILPLSALVAGFAEPPASPPSPPMAVCMALPVPVIDCNENGIEDAVDIAFGTSSDVDQDGIPDECQRDGLQAP